jgi:hypothetical protein
VSVHTVIVCDRCGATVLNEFGHLAAENDARAKGWFIGNHDLCEKCWPREPMVPRHRTFRQKVSA